MFDDLLFIVATYSTTSVTLGVITLSRQMASDAVRGEYLWRRKVEFETRSRCFEPSKISDWWVYYLKVNRTFYGQLDSSQVPLGSFVTAAGGGVAPDTTTCIQLDYGVVGTDSCLGMVRISFTKRLVKMVGAPGRVYGLTERGDVWKIGTIFGISTRKLPGTDVSDIGYDAGHDTVVTLDRSGNMGNGTEKYFGAGLVHLVSDRTEPEHRPGVSVLRCDGRSFKILFGDESEIDETFSDRKLLSWQFGNIDTTPELETAKSPRYFLPDSHFIPDGLDLSRH